MLDGLMGITKCNSDSGKIGISPRAIEYKMHVEFYRDTLRLQENISDLAAGA